MARPFAIIGFACFGAWFAASLIGFNAIVVLAVLCLLLFLTALLWPPLRRRAVIGFPGRDFRPDKVMARLVDIVGSRGAVLPAAQTL